MALFLLTACGDGQADTGRDSHDPEPVTTNDPQNGNGNPATETPNNDSSHSDNPDQQGTPDFALRVGDFLIEMDQDIEKVLAAIGEPQGIFVAPSCAFDGEDRIFQYSNIQIHTYPKGEADLVHTISLRDDTIRTTEGRIRLGSNQQDMLEMYGDEYEYDNGMYTYTRGSTLLEFYVEDGIVTGITYGFIIPQ